MFMKRRINHIGHLWKKSYLLFFSILFLQLCPARLSCDCNYHISLACGVSPLEHQSGWLFACAATTAREVHNYLFFSQNKFARACFWVHSLPQAAVDIKENPFRMWSALCANNKAVHHGEKLWNTTLSPPPLRAHTWTHTVFPSPLYLLCSPCIHSLHLCTQKQTILPCCMSEQTGSSTALLHLNSQI